MLSLKSNYQKEGSTFTRFLHFLLPSGPPAYCPLLFSTRFELFSACYSLRSLTPSPQIARSSWHRNSIRGHKLDGSCHLLRQSNNNLFSQRLLLRVRWPLPTYRTVQGAAAAHSLECPVDFQLYLLPPTEWTSCELPIAFFHCTLNIF